MDKNNKWYAVVSPKTMRQMATAAATLAILASASAPVLAAGPERSLAGIAIFAPGSEVTHKFGNPSQILVGGAAPGSATAGNASGMGSQGGSPGSQGGFPGASPGMGGGGYPGSQGGFSRGGESAGGGTGALPGFPGMSSGGGFPGSQGGFPGAQGGASSFPGGATSTAPVKPPVTLVYDRANGGSLEFTISPDKRVVQIRETGYVGAYATSRGIKLGMSYSAVVAKYGYQENTMIAGSIINIDYKDTLHCGFQFLDQKLVAIIVSSPD
ncbi:MAG: hypothetical protein ACRYFS_15925 [Janthinobacterium lividum]